MNTFKISYLATALTVTWLVECMNSGDVRPRSPVRRFIYDPNPKLTGWASWEQYAACSTGCVAGYENETKQCCETGDNRLCFYLPWDKLKPYVGTCPNTTSITTTLTTRERQTTAKATPSTTVITKTMPTATRTTTTTTASSTTAYRTTQPHPRTLAPIATSCAVCAGPSFLCEKLFTPQLCEPPNNYCINKIANYVDGTRSVVRSCGNFETCYRDWFRGSSDSDRCMRFDGNAEYRSSFTCTFCCVKDNCNEPLLPALDTLYKP